MGSRARQQRELHDRLHSISQFLGKRELHSSLRQDKIQWCKKLYFDFCKKKASAAPYNMSENIAKFYTRYNYGAAKNTSALFSHKNQSME